MEPSGGVGLGGRGRKDDRAGAAEGGGHTERADTLSTSFFLGSRRYKILSTKSYVDYISTGAAGKQNQLSLILLAS